MRAVAMVVAGEAKGAMRVMRVARGCGVAVVVFAAVALALPGGVARAASLVVNSCGDAASPPSGTVTLRSAIAAAGDGETVTFGVDCPSGAGTQITLTNGALMITANVTIDATSPAHTIAVDGNHATRVFFVVTGGTAAQPVVLKGLTIQHGNSGIGDGGGITKGGGYMTVTNCTLSGNVGGEGGGIDNFASTLTVTNGTLSGNTVANTFSGAGGGIANFGATATVTNSTFSGNTAVQIGGIANLNSGTATLTNTIVAGSGATGGDLFGLFTGSNNLIDDNTGTLTGSNNRTNVPALLGPLGSYGGATQTLPLLPGSPALDAGAPVAFAVVPAGTGAAATLGAPNPATTDAGGTAGVGATLKVGEVRQYAATGTYADGSTADVTSAVAWTSAAPHVAGVDGTTGKATGLSPGTAHVAATRGDQRGGGGGGGDGDRDRARAGPGGEAGGAGAPGGTASPPPAPSPAPAPAPLPTGR